MLSPPRPVAIRDAQYKSVGQPTQRRMPPCCGVAAGGVMAQPGEGSSGSSSSSGAGGWALSSLLSSKYDKEIVSVAVPALAAMLLEPIMGAINSGALWCGVGSVWLPASLHVTLPADGAVELAVMNSGRWGRTRAWSGQYTHACML